MMKTVFILASLIAFVSCQINFAGNVTVQNPGQYAYRDMAVAIINFPNVLEGAFFETTSTVNGTNQKDLVTGSFYVFNGLLPPTATVSFYDQFSSYQRGTGQMVFSFNAQAADTFVVNLFSSLEEVNANNATVNAVNLATDLNWALTTANPVVNGMLQTITIKGTNTQLLGANFSISITVVFSQVLGLLNVVGTPIITPKSLETIVNIVGYPYQAKTNSLRLNMIVATGMTSLTVQGNVTITAGNGTSTGYVRVSDQVQVDGNVKTATITVVSQTQNGQTGNTYVDQQMTAKFQTQFMITQLAIQFPAGANSITFDPTAGAGAPAPQLATTNSQGRIAPILALLFLFVLLAI